MAAISDEEQERIIKVLREASEIEEKEQERIGYTTYFIIQYMHSIHTKERLTTLEKTFIVMKVLFVFTSFCMAKDFSYHKGKISCIFVKKFFMSVYVKPLLFIIHALHTAWQEFFHIMIRVVKQDERL